MGKPEARIENYLRRRVKEEGGQIRKMRWIGRRGAADNFMWWPEGKYAFVEVKAEGCDVDWRSLQGREIRRMYEDGIAIWVVKSHEEVDRLIAEVKGG